MSSVGRVLAAAALLCALVSAEAGGTAPLRWVEGVVAGQAPERLALLVQIGIDGRRCWFQLDTGLDSVVRWHGEQDAAATVALDAAGQRWIVSASQRLIDILKTSDGCGQTGAVGSIGNAFFDDGSVTLDLAGLVLHYRRGSVLRRESAAAPFQYLAEGREGAHVVVDAQLPDGQPARFMLDTGSVRFGWMVFRADDWRRLTGRPALAASEAVQAFPISSWGRRHVCFEAPGVRPATVGRWTVDVSPIAICPDMAFVPPSGVDGVLGLRPFQGRTVVLDYRAKRWKLR
jgi:hypothetical protein